MEQVQRFLTQLKLEGSSPATVKWYRIYLDRFAAHIPKPLAQVTDAEVYSFRDLYEDKHTQANALRAVKRLMKFSGIGMSIVLPKYVEPAVEEYTPDEMRRLFAVMTPEEIRVWSFFRMTGCREQEVSHAIWENLHRHEYVVAPYDGWSPKKHKSRRVPTPDALWELLEPYRSTGLMFPNTRGGVEGHFHRKLHWIVKRAGMDCSKFWLHKFRSSFATAHLRNGADIHEVAAWLGHSDLSTVLRYLALTQNDSERVRSLANGAFK